MIIVRLTGGLGNQLFQYATARRLAKKNNTELLIDISWFDAPPAHVTPRRYELFHYAIQARLLSKEELLFPSLFRNKVLKRLPLPRPRKLIREKDFCFQEKVLSLSDNVYLDGYWQSYKYFTDVRKTLLDELRPATPMSRFDEIVAEKIDKTNSVSIHVRRGDYVSLASAARTHGLCTIQYYQSAVGLLQERVKDPTFFVFSDDPEWTKGNLHFESPTVYVTHNDSRNAFQDLHLMSMCENQIIANSSFSWWGAWLNTNSEKIVVAPEKWFTARPNITKDLCPENWIKL